MTIPVWEECRAENGTISPNRSSIKRTIEEGIGEKTNLQSVRFQLPEMYSVERSKSSLANISWFR